MPALPKTTRTRPWRQWVCCTVLVVCAAAASLHSAPGRYITVAWDPSRDERVVGYAVYLGTVSGKYDKVFIVGNRTYFTYADAVPERQYYFVVVAYTASLVSDMSQEVSGYGQSTPALPVTGELAVSNVSSSPDALNAMPAPRCPAGAGSGCDGTAIVARSEQTINALAATGDGRVLLVEDGRRIRFFDGRALSSDAALVAPPHVTFIGIAVDPRLDQRSRIYVAEAEPRDDGTREVRIVRYRDLQDTLGEPAVIVPAVYVPGAGDAPFTVDSTGRIFIAIPSVPANGTSSPALVLGFESDGSALRYNRAASPIVAWAPSAPAAIAWDDAAQQLWLSAVEGNGSTLVRIPVNRLNSTDTWPRVPLGVSVPSRPRTLQEPRPTFLLRMPAAGPLVQILRGGNDVEGVSRFEQEEVTATTTDQQTGSAYVATRSGLGAGSYLYRFAEQ